jgi:hypothetical protein
MVAASEFLALVEQRGEVRREPAQSLGTVVHVVQSGWRRAGLGLAPATAARSPCGSSGATPRRRTGSSIVCGSQAASRAAAKWTRAPLADPMKITG